MSSIRYFSRKINLVFFFFFCNTNSFSFIFTPKFVSYSLVYVIRHVGYLRNVVLGLIELIDDDDGCVKRNGPILSALNNAWGLPSCTGNFNSC